MRVVKRYPNRKLYDTVAKQYIRLDEITQLIRAGEEVQVIDHASGEDLTALTLTQIIFEEEKKQSGLLPRAILTGLIRSSGDKLTAFQRNLFSSTFWNQIDEEIKSRMGALVKLGEVTEEDARKLLDKLLNPEIFQSHEPVKPVARGAISDQALEEYLKAREIPTQDDLQHLYQQLETLTSKLESLSQAEPQE